MATHYSYATPLKRVDTVSVAKGMADVMSHTGVSKEILIDQGSVFVGRFSKEICKLLGVHALKTSSPTRRQTGCLNAGILRKLEGRKTDWDKLVKYCLMAYRATPHAITGFSPYALIHGWE